MSRSQSQSSKRSSLRIDKTLPLSPDLSDFSEQNENQSKSQNETNSQRSGRIGLRKSSQLSDFSRQMSQTSVDKIDDWKGSQVVNYKTFKKVSPNCSQNSLTTEKVIRLKKIKVEVNKDLSLNETKDQMNDKSLDSELSLHLF